MSQDTQSRAPAREIFMKTAPEIQEIIRSALREERDVQHLKKKTEIHVKLYEHIRRIIK